jgi:tetratricopeptide (TPR) repeat protein
MLDIPQAFDRAMAAYRTGRLGEAQQMCRQIIAASPDVFEALYLLAVVQSGLGEQEAAVGSYDRALALRPDYVEALLNRGITLHRLRRFEEALASYDRALALRPDHAEALYNRGVTLQAVGRFEEALSSYDRALAMRPDHAELLSNRGVVLHALRRLDEALASYDRALALRPESAGVLHNRGATLHELDHLEEALSSYDRALALEPDYAEALYHRGIVLQGLDRFGAALTSFERVLAIEPNHAGALARRGAVLYEQKRFEEALASFDRALALQPDHPEIVSNRGVILHALDRFDEALESQDRAIVARPRYPEALAHRGINLYALKRFDEALASWDRALLERPHYADARLNQAICRLLTGNFETGWQQYQSRWDTRQARQDRRDLAPPLWLGAEEIAGKTILLHAEQGLGDAIQFCRYVPLVADRGARVVLEVPDALRELMETLEGTAQVVSKGAPLPDADLHCPLLSLPLAFGTRLETIPSRVPYLRAPPHRSHRWGTDPRLQRRPRVGLAWSGSPLHNNDHRRSIALRRLLSLLDTDATFVSLQKHLRADDAAVLKACGDLLPLGDELDDFADAAAVMSELDLVISADTSVAHLAGALAKPVWVLLPFVPDWRWLLDREDSPWYPTARLFRQDESGSWDGPIGRVRTALQEFV